MSDTLRVRLEFRGFVKKDLQKSLLSFKKSETKDVQSLQRLIQRRFNLDQSFGLLIDNFNLEQTEPIDILRDNDLIVIEPKVKPKIEPKIEIKNEFIIKSEKSVKSLPKAKQRPNFDRNDSKVSFKSSYIKSEIDSNVIKSENKRQFESHLIDVKKSETQVMTSRDIPQRKAFQSANTLLKEKPLFIKKTPFPEASGSQTKPTVKRKRATKEATEPLDMFSPFIVLERLSLPVLNSNAPDIQPINQSLNVKANKVKQSARKSFPTKNCGTNCGSNSQMTSFVKEYEKKISLKTIDCDSCEPLTSIPRLGDIIAFKMLTLSSDGSRLESSPFNCGSVLDINTDTQMVDILLEGVLNRKDKSDEQIHSLKINWSTVLEPKIIQRSVSELNS